MPSMWQAMQNTDWLHCCWLWSFGPLLLYAWLMIVSFLRCRLCLTLCIEANVASKIRKQQLAAFLKFSKVLILFFRSFHSDPFRQFKIISIKLLRNARSALFLIALTEIILRNMSAA